jgi:hypothetical protein
MNPTNTHSLTRQHARNAFTRLFDESYNLMAWNNGQTRRKSSAFNFIEFRMADAAHEDSQQNLTSRGLGNRQLDELKRCIMVFDRHTLPKDHGLHFQFAL